MAGNDNKDTALLVKLAGAPTDLSSVASVKGTYAHAVGLNLLCQMEQDVSKISFVFKASWEECAKALLRDLSQHLISLTGLA